MTFSDYLRQHNALTEENVTQPRLGEWVKKYLDAYPLEQQEKELLTRMAQERWYDAEQVLEELGVSKPG